MRYRQNWMWNKSDALLMRCVTTFGLILLYLGNIYKMENMSKQILLSQELKLNVNHQIASSEWKFGVTPGVGNQMSGVSSVTQDTPLALPLWPFVTM